LCGSHAGVSIGEDGPSQMALEDLAMMRAVHGSVVRYPCDAGQTARLVQRMAEHRGIAYLRTTREKTLVRYPATMTFTIGGSVTLAQSTEDHVTIVAAGVTVAEAVKAHDHLREAGVRARVIDAYSVKPIDRATLKRAAAETGALIVVEDHWPEGGLGDAVLDVFADASVPPRVLKLAPRAMPGSATPDEQRRVAGIDAEAIVRAAHALRDAI
ncbi:MAG: transketolase, partial [Dehalococcoidia bacterium]|nr:transketolase [Dehalococcoidia bacterium]